MGVQLCIACMKTCDSVRIPVFHNFELSILTKLVTLIKMFKCSKAQIGKHLSDSFSTQSVLKLGDALLTLFFSFTLEYVIRKVQENQEGMKQWNTSVPGLCWC
jgi:hypothetical protein